MNGNLITLITTLSAPSVGQAIKDLTDRGQKVSNNDLQLILLADISKTQHEMKEEMHSDHDNFTDGFDRMGAMLTTIQTDVRTNQTLLIEGPKKKR